MAKKLNPVGKLTDEQCKIEFVRLMGFYGIQQGEPLGTEFQERLTQLAKRLHAAGQLTKSHKDFCEKHGIRYQLIIDSADASMITEFVQLVCDAGLMDVKVIEAFCHKTALPVKLSD